MIPYRIDIGIKNDSAPLDPLGLDALRGVRCLLQRYPPLHQDVHSNGHVAGGELCHCSAELRWHRPIIPTPSSTRRGVTFHVARRVIGPQA